MKLTVPEVLSRFKSYHEQNPCWGALHIVLEDNNVDDRFVKYCKEDAIIKGDKEAEKLSDILLTMSKTQRLKLSSIA